MPRTSMDPNHSLNPQKSWVLWMNQNLGDRMMAEREGFEPSIRF